MGKNILIVFPHGLGDFVHLSGVFKKYKHNNPNNNIYFALRDNQIKTKLYSRYDFISGILPIPNPYWRYFFSPRLDQVRKIISNHEIYFDELFNIPLVKDKVQKAIEEVCLILGVTNPCSQCKPYFPILKKENRIGKLLASKYYREDKKKIFQHLTSSSFWKKVDIDNKVENAITIDLNYDPNCWPIGVAAYLMSIADKLVLVDSVMLHIASALGLTIDIGFLTPIVNKGGYKSPPELKVLNLEIIGMRNNKSKRTKIRDRLRIFLRACFPYIPFESSQIVKSFIMKNNAYILLSRRLTNLFNLKTQYNLILETKDNQTSRSTFDRLTSNSIFLSLDFSEQKLLLQKIMKYILHSYD